MRDTGAWLNEGIATFYEPVLRARAGWKSEDDVWREWISSMPRGMPAITGIGLENAGRGGIYWGGAVFVLMAEIESLQASGGKIGFSDCLRTVLAEGADVTVKWPTMKLLDRCDALLGKQVIAHARQAAYREGLGDGPGPSLAPPRRVDGGRCGALRRQRRAGLAAPADHLGRHHPSRADSRPAAFSAAAEMDALPSCSHLPVATGIGLRAAHHERVRGEQPEIALARGPHREFPRRRRDAGDAGVAARALRDQPAWRRPVAGFGGRLGRGASGAHRGAGAAPRSGRGLGSRLLERDRRRLFQRSAADPL